MGKYESIFDKIGKAKALNAWEPSLPQGKHRVAMVKYGCKTSAKDKSVFLEAEFIVLQTSNDNVRLGSRHSWPWFINKPDEFGYTASRAKSFLEVLQKCIGNTSDTTAFGNALAEDFEGGSPEGYGIVLEVDVTRVLDAGGNSRRGKRGNEIYNASWTPVVQDESDIMTTRARLAELAGNSLPGSNGTMHTGMMKTDTEIMKTDAVFMVNNGTSNEKKGGGLARLLSKQL